MLRGECREMPWRGILAVDSTLLGMRFFIGKVPEQYVNCRTIFELHWESLANSANFYLFLHEGWIQI